MEMPIKHKCVVCGKVKLISEFYRWKWSRDGYSFVCKRCDKERIKEWQQQHPEKTREYGRRWRGKNKSRIRLQIAVNAIYTERKGCQIKGCTQMGERYILDLDNPLEIVWLCRKHNCAVRKGEIECPKSASLADLGLIKIPVDKKQASVYFAPRRRLALGDRPNKIQRPEATG